MIVNWLLGLCIFSLLLFSSCVSDEEVIEDDVDSIFASVGMFGGELKLSEAPVVGNTATLYSKFIVRGEYDQIKFFVDITDGFELVDGDIEWNGSIINPDSENNGFYKLINLTATVKAVKKGNWTLKGYLLLDDGPKTFGGLGRIYVTIGEEESKIYIDSFKENKQCEDKIVEGILIRCTDPNPSKTNQEGLQ